MKLPRTHLLILVSMCSLLAAIIGLLTNVQGLFFTPIAEELGVLKGEVSLTITIASVCSGIGGIFAPRLFKLVKMRVLTAIMCMVICAATAASGICHSIMPLYLLSAVRGFASGITGMVFATTILNNWFEANIGLVTSIAVGCSGISGSVFSLLMSGVIQASGWRAAYVVAAAIVALLMLPAVLFVPTLTPQESGLLPHGAQEPLYVEASTKAQANAMPIHAGLFALVFLYAVFSHGPAGISQHMPGLAESVGLGAGVGAAMLSASMVTNTVGKIAFGALSDAWGARRTIIIFCAVASSALVALMLAHTPGISVVASAAYGFTFATNTVGITMLTRDVFGVVNYSRVYPIVVFGASLAYSALTAAYGFMYDFTGSYILPLIVALAMAVAAVVVSQLAYALGARGDA
ncbi:MAG: MFS transporter [Coriobacteriales bacterium]|nr:MFS transporter [Coriobacteriales bacterium]